MTPAPDTTLAGQGRIVEELARQHEILSRGTWLRNVLVAIAYALCTLYVAPWLIALLLAIDIVVELVSLRLLRGLDPATAPNRYRLSLLAVVVMEAVFASAAGLVWLNDDPYAKALATGLVMTALLQLGTVRSIHLPFGLAGLATVTLVALGFNLAHWLAHWNPVGLALSTIAALGAASYGLAAMISNNALHRAGAEAAAAARASDAAKSLFLAQMSHELRTPLNAIIGLGEVEAAAAQGVSRDRLRLMVNSARGLAVVLDDVLDLSSLTEGRVAISPAPTDLAAELGATVAAFQTEAARSGASLSLTLPPHVPAFVRLDAQRLRQCLSNLISNALKHGCGGAIRVEARWGDGRLEIEVADDGPGVPPWLERSLFQPFQRADRGVPGLGLGLAISRGLARQMGGDLVLLPSPRGALFRLTIAAPVTRPPLPAVKADLTGQRVLVVDDIATNRLVAATLLQALGGEAVQAASGEEALELLARGGIDLVLLDMSMPRMDGFETLRRMREGPGAGVPVVAMTAAAMAAQRAEAMAAGLDGFVAKPLLPELLAAELAPILARKRGGNRQQGGAGGHDDGRDGRQGEDHGIQQGDNDDR